jgi:hypothetical protein
MASRVWNDINLPGFARSQVEEEKKSVVTGVEDNTPDEEPENEVRIVSAEWVPGSKGFQYNEQCFCDVSAEYLKETSRAKLRGNLHGIFDGTDVDMGLTVEGCIDDATMIARISIPKLYFVNNDHYAAWQEDSTITCQYYLKDINHSLGANKIDSPMLDMPNDETAELQKLTVQLSIDPDDPDCQNDTFTLFSTDDERSYEQVKIVQDDALKNNNTVELIFTDLDENLSYTLEHDNGDGDTVVLLQNRAYGKWAGATEGLAESGKGGSGKKGGGLFKKIGDVKNKVSQAKSAVNNKIAQANELKQSATQKVNEAKTQANDIKQSATDKVNEAKTQANDIKSQGEAAVKDKINQANEIKQNATNQVNEAKAQANDIKSQGEAAVKDKMNQANEIKQSAANQVNEAKAQVNDIKSQGEAAVKDKINQANEIKQSAANQVNEAKAQANDIKSQGEAAVKDKMNQANEIKQSAANQVNEAKAQANDVKSQGEAAVKDKMNQANEIKQSASDKVSETKSQATGSLKDKLAAINSSRENAQKTASAAKEKAAATANTADKMADSLKSVPKFTI